MKLDTRSKIILAVVAGIVVVACYTINDLTSGSNTSGGTTFNDVLKELVDNVGFIVLCVLLVLGLVFLPVGL